MENEKSTQTPDKAKEHAVFKENKLKIDKIKNHLKEIYEGGVFENGIYNGFVNTIKLFIISTRKFFIDDCLTKASAIAYTAIISLIPALTVLLTFYSIFSGAGNKKEELFREISMFMVEHSIKLNIDPVFNAISALIDNAGKIGGIGAIIMIFSATTTLRALEKSLNHIMKVKQGRTVFQKVVYYWAALTLGPVMLIAGTTVATKLSNVFSSPNYNAAQVFNDDMWIVGQKGTILKKKISSKSTPVKIEIESVDFENQNNNTYDAQTSEFITDEIRLDSIAFSKINFTDIQFIGSYGWVAGDRGVVLTTQDGGKTWKINKFGNFTLNDICMINQTRGVIASNNGIILTTMDGGVSWDVKELDDISTNFSSIAYNKETVIITGSKGKILLSVDSGSTWTKKTINESKRKNRLVDLNHVEFTKTGDAWIAGNDGIILVSKNNGHSWTQKKFKEYNYYTSCFTDKGKGYFAGENGVLISTSDGGKSWKSEKLPAYRINSIFEVKNSLFAIGNSGTLQEKNKEGTVWTGESGKGFFAIAINFLAPFFFIWILFLLTYSTMPNTKIPFRYSSAGAAFTGAIWVIFILIFIIYIKAFATGTFAIYGALASIPLFLLMIYASALIILFGAEVAFTLMHPETYRNLKRNLEDGTKVNIYYGLMLLQHIYSQFESGKGSPSYSEIMKKFSYNSSDLDYFIDMFSSKDLIAVSENGEYMPTTSSSKIRLIDVFNLINEAQVYFPGTARKGTAKSEIKEIFDSLRNAREDVLKNITLKDIIV